MLKLKLQYFGTWHEELTHLKRPWCWERLKVGGEGDDRGWYGWMASLTQWTWVWVNSTSWWWTGRPGVLWFMGSQRIGHDWVTELNWTADKESFCYAGDPGSVPGLRRSPGEGNGNPFQYSCLENSIDRGAWWAILHKVTESDMTEQFRVGTQPHPSAENWIKYLLSMALPTRTRPSFLHSQPSYQEACTRLLSSSISGQTKWKPQSIKTNQNNHMDHSFV